jgi:hypothetical protein
MMGMPTAVPIGEEMEGLPVAECRPHRYMSAKNPTGFSGVKKATRGAMFEARCEQQHLGVFPTAEEAADAYARHQTTRGIVALPYQRETNTEAEVASWMHQVDADAGPPRVSGRGILLHLSSTSNAGYLGVVKVERKRKTPGSANRVFYQSKQGKKVIGGISESAMEAAEKYAIWVGGTPRPDGAAPRNCAWDAGTGEWVSLSEDDETLPQQTPMAPPPRSPPASPPASPSASTSPRSESLPSPSWLTLSNNTGTRATRRAARSQEHDRQQTARETAQAAVVAAPDTVAADAITETAWAAREAAEVAVIAAPVAVVSTAAVNAVVADAVTETAWTLCRLFISKLKERATLRGSPWDEFVPATRPPSLPQEVRLGSLSSKDSSWTPLYQDASHEVLLLNTRTGAIRDAPWICLRNRDGTLYFANLITRETRWLPPSNWMAGWRARIYPCMSSPTKGGFANDLSTFQWNSERAYDERNGLMYLGTEARKHAEGGAPYLYEAQQGKPQYPPDEYDTAQTYPM